ncbi:aquaporin [Candidatus Peregrinibacteria bacterium]|nr:aquaporin [Candidatus Peregrinibacteria bacterium]
MTSHTRAYAAEFLGTAILTLLVSLSLVRTLLVPTPIIAGLTLGMIVFAFGPVSGAHVNPAVTLSLLSIKKITPRDAGYYILAQIGGALLAMLLTFALTGMIPALYPKDAVDLHTLQVVLAEAFGAFVFVSGICAVVYGKVKPEFGGFVVGGSLLMGILLASGISNGVLNPAVALGIGSLSVSYVVGPILGGAAAAWMYRWIIK